MLCQKQADERNKTFDFFYNQRVKEFLELTKITLVCRAEMWLMGGEFKKAQADYDEVTKLDESLHPFSALVFSKALFNLDEVTLPAKRLVKAIFTRCDGPSKQSTALQLIAGDARCILSTLADVGFVLCTPWSVQLLPSCPHPVWLGCYAYKFAPLYFDRRNGVAVAIVRKLAETVLARVKGTPASVVYFSPATIVWLFEYCSQFGIELLAGQFELLEQFSLQEASKHLNKAIGPESLATFFRNSQLLARVDEYFTGLDWPRTPFEGDGI